jgi:hypothetical protein
MSSITGSAVLLPTLEQALHLCKGGIALEVPRRRDGARADQIGSTQTLVRRESAEMRG